eukprot:TRINITY_DN10687_c0_g1_i4.p1 TRINITY_DN10687_c0_g1~~TRINITY_DN10687_c0_g1_i4.p1  ORF type:complete len:672 (-),score=132.57 TRINITY_DN10687_c0_g1_i4:534-2549(-)
MSVTTEPTQNCSEGFTVKGLSEETQGDPYKQLVPKEVKTKFFSETSGLLTRTRKKAGEKQPKAHLKFVQSIDQSPKIEKPLLRRGLIFDVTAGGLVKHKWNPTEWPMQKRLPVFIRHDSTPSKVQISVISARTSEELTICTVKKHVNSHAFRVFRFVCREKESSFYLTLYCKGQEISCSSKCPSDVKILTRLHYPTETITMTSNAIRITARRGERPGRRRYPPSVGGAVFNTLHKQDRNNTELMDFDRDLEIEDDVVDGEGGWIPGTQSDNTFSHDDDFLEEVDLSKLEDQDVQYEFEIQPAQPESSVTSIAISPHISPLIISTPNHMITPLTLVDVPSTSFSTSIPICHATPTPSLNIVSPSSKVQKNKIKATPNVKRSSTPPIQTSTALRNPNYTHPTSTLPSISTSVPIPSHLPSQTRSNSEVSSEEEEERGNKKRKRTQKVPTDPTKKSKSHVNQKNTISLGDGPTNLEFKPGHSVQNEITDSAMRERNDPSANAKRGTEIRSAIPHTNTGPIGSVLPKRPRGYKPEIKKTDIPTWMINECKENPFFLPVSTEFLSFSLTEGGTDWSQLQFELKNQELEQLPVGLDSIAIILRCFPFQKGKLHSLHKWPDQCYVQVNESVFLTNRNTHNPGIQGLTEKASVPGNITSACILGLNTVRVYHKSSEVVE